MIDEQVAPRRAILAAAWAAGAGIATATGRASDAGAAMRTDRIDFHHHIVPPVYRETLARAGISDVGGVPLPAWSPEQMLRNMDTLGVAKALASISSPGVYFGDIAFAIDLARRCNDALAELSAANPARIGGFVQLPLPDVDAALKELDRLDKLRLDGVMLLTNYGGKYLGHPDFAPVLAEMSRRKTLVFLHPNLPAGVGSLGLSLPAPILEFVFDTTRCVADMIFTGVFDRAPGIRWVVSHLGGALPYISWRLSMIETSPRPVYAEFRARGRSVRDYLRGLHYDTAVSASPAALKACVEVVGADRLVFGSDVPFAAFDFVQATTANLDAYDAFDEAARAAIAFKTGTALLARS